ncbi:hypothetical protein BWI17_17725 [Betaproteobacteria bacterium GR16-43]|nr:hypothetical protein BWI17_17725 [Betaproteobacteria bacterium GR16-43]
MAAASEEFAQRGYAGARIRNIVDAAGANLASVNYYFGGKEGLYRATLGFLAGRAMAGFSGPAVDRRDPSPRKRLYRLVYAFLEGLSDAPTSPALGRILAHEAMDPSPNLDRLIEEMLRPQLDHLRHVVRQIAGSRVPDAEVTSATIGIAGQCLIYLFGRPALDRIFPQAVRGPRAHARLARQIADFSIAGIEALVVAHDPRSHPPPAARKRPLRGH